jgi:hypothetical protein
MDPGSGPGVTRCRRTPDTSGLLPSFLTPTRACPGPDPGNPFSSERDGGRQYWYAAAPRGAAQRRDRSDHNHLGGLNGPRSRRASREKRGVHRYAAAPRGAAQRRDRSDHNHLGGLNGPRSRRASREKRGVHRYAAAPRGAAQRRDRPIQATERWMPTTLPCTNTLENP